MTERSFQYSPITENTNITTINLDTRLAYHIETGDFFPLLATLIGFLEETVADPEVVSEELRAMQASMAHSLRQDLRDIGEQYELTQRSALT